MTKSAPASGSFTNYTDYVNFLAERNDHYLWLAEFFNTPSPKESSTKLTVLDSEDGSLIEKHVPIRDLRNCPAPIKTRVVVLRYEETWKLDRQLMDGLAFALDLPPYYLWQHLDHVRLNEEQAAAHERPESYPKVPARAGLGLRPRLRAALYWSFELRFYYFQQVSAIFLPCNEPSKANIVLVMIRDNESLYSDFYSPHSELNPLEATRGMDVPSNAQVHWSDSYVHDLRAMISDDCASANRSIFDYIVPYIRRYIDNIAIDHAEALENIYYTANYRTNDPDYLHELSETVFFQVGAVEEVKQEVETFLKRKNIEPSAFTAELLEDIDGLLVELHRTQSRLRNDVARDVSLLALQESRKSIEHAESGKRLAQLAYIYLPLAFSSSLFGMNVTTLQGTTLWSFVVTSVVLLVCSLLLWWSFIPLVAAFHAIERRWDGGAIWQKMSAPFSNWAGYVRREKNQAETD